MLPGCVDPLPPGLADPLPPRYFTTMRQRWEHQGVSVYQGFTCSIQFEHVGFVHEVYRVPAPHVAMQLHSYCSNFFVVHGASGFYVNRVNRVLWAWFCDSLSLPLP